ncbi:uncharacterized protein B0J16DRAFT_163637 [Fusarium flagelliforme]|uniref:Uncharacterized protein n=1 Tax=Fusarium flagelliforme TaxID=2675880 RepID=A0A395N299_9HYPO|nr:uncharacterized protein B0J16DRAFT_163637 [Fusarium flagelliforme]KAH7183331.1 hypothetical protein B0J16DRAFT_163637 [Fusarium flagelliforme]RFN54248.1 hypothetical protein FIE12Z_1374 [Fusarium flagelliforme]
MADTIKKLLADDSISAQDAAQKIAGSCINEIEKNEDDSKIEDELDALWSGILTAAEQTPHDRQDKLVQIMQAIKGLSPASEKAKKISVWGEEKRWDELPMFGGKAREQLDIAQEKSDEACVNVNAFFARVTAAGIDDFTLYAIWILREALEDPTADDIAQQTSPKLLKATSVWLVYASDTLSKATKEGKQFDGKMARPGASLKDDVEWRGFCQDRWNAWKERLSLLKNADLSGDTKSLIKQGVDNMTHA